MPEMVYLSLGSNLGDRAGNLTAAIAALAGPGFLVMQISQFYETEPVDILDQPWFLNCVLEGKTTLTAAELLAKLRAVESQIGTEKLIPRGPRRIDLDILLFGENVVDTPGLQIPHPRMNERRFVLVPLAELAPSLVHPVARKTVTRLLQETADRSLVRAMAAAP